MGVRKKVSLGFVVIGLILFISGVIAIFEFSRMSRSVTVLITKNMNSINTARALIDISDDYNFDLLRHLGTDSVDILQNLPDKDSRFEDKLESIRESFTTISESSVADSIKMVYDNYIAVISESDTVWTRQYSERRTWYFTELQPVYYKLRSFINQLIELSQNELTLNSASLKDSFYRSIMPGVVSVGAGLVLILLFNYFINLYLISPVIRISKGIRSYRDMNKSYNVTIENDDELQDLNVQVKEIIDENKKMKKYISRSEAAGNHE